MKLITGTINRAKIQLQKPDGTAEASVAAASSIVAALEAADRSRRLAGPYTAASGTTGADWSTGLVVVDLPKADLDAALALLGAPGVLVHVVVTLAGVSTHYYPPLPVPLVAGFLP